MEALARTCAHHPQRAGFALCMRCRQVVCQECATTFDGINYCRPCLDAKRARPSGEAGWRRWGPVVAQAAVAAALVAVSVRLMAWALSVMAGWG